MTRYVVITPVRDEEAYLRFTLESMIAQTVRPIEWIIVDDGSSDGTGEILDDYSRRRSWIRGLHRENRGFRKSGGGVVEAFNAGYAALATADWDYIVKLDGDLTFEPDYFQKVFRTLSKRPASGPGRRNNHCHILNGIKTTEPHPASFTYAAQPRSIERFAGMRSAASGPRPDLGHLGPEVKANMLGWKSKKLP